MSTGTVRPPVLPAEIRSVRVHRSQFITPQHYEAWMDGTPLRRHIPGRKKIDRDLREIVYRERGRKCAICGRTDYLTVDHIVPVELGGATNSENSRVLCGTHNRECWQKVFAPYVRALDRWLEVAA